MNIEFHYYALHYLARSAGFPEDDASILAISSQLVDECIAPWEIAGSAGLATKVTQNYVFWDEAVARDMYRPFHFVPGDRGKASANRLDGEAGRYAVTEDSPLARELLIAALKSRNLFRIGIALHAYADSWAHQNFSGDSEPQNALDASAPLPAVGHLQAFGSPDDPRISWRDARLKPELAEIVNARRFARAAAMVYRFLCAYGRRSFSDESFVVDRLAELWRVPGGDSAARASDYIIALDVPPYEPEAWARRAGGAASGILGAPADPFASGYDRLAWLRRAAAKASSAMGGVRGRIPASGYSGSLFEAWNRAAGEHLAFCKSLFTQRGIE